MTPIIQAFAPLATYIRGFEHGVAGAPARCPAGADVTEYDRGFADGREMRATKVARGEDRA